MPEYVKDKNNTFVVIPAYNEATVIFNVINELRRFFPNIVVVDDGSTDGTADFLRKEGVLLVTHAVNLGQGAALQTGITYALNKGAEWIITFDADGQHKVEDALEMLRVLQTGECDVVLGSRFLTNDGTINIPTVRAIILKLLVFMSNFRSRQKLTDIHNGLRAFNRTAAKMLDITQNGMAHATDIVRQFSQRGMIIREMPVTIRYTDYSLSKGQSIFNGFNILVDLHLGRFRR